MDYKIEFVGAHKDNYEVNGVVDPVTGIKHKPIAIVNHIAEGTLEGTVSWFKNPKSQASTNFMVGKDGRIVQFVKDGVDRPFANGNIAKPTWPLLIRRSSDNSYVNPNRYTLSVEHHGKTGEPFTEEMYQATLWLHKHLIEKWNIPIDRDHIIGHNRIDGVTRANCPGTGFPWDRLFKDLLEWQESKRMNNNKWTPQGEGLRAVKSLAEKKLINNPSEWTEDKMMEPAPTWLVMTLIDRITKNR